MRAILPESGALDFLTQAIFIEMKHTYIPQGTCSRMIEFEINPDGTVSSLKVTGGCHGNLQGIAALVEGMSASEAVRRLQGIRCGNKPTSCPDQLARAISQALSKIG